MSNKLLGFLAVVGVLVALYFYTEDKKKKRRIEQLEEDRFKLIMESIQANKDLTAETRRQLKEVAKQFEKLDKRVSRELIKALQLFQIGQKENAIEDLVKIIEHLLTVYYGKHEGFLDWLKAQKKKVSLHNLLEFCRKDQKINDVEFQFFVALKEIRNKEDHTVDFKLDDHLNASSLVIGLRGIMKLSSIVY
jgi:iron-sulfur cluster repair protein YtfE (RIC family)